MFNTIGGRGLEAQKGLGTQMRVLGKPAGLELKEINIFGAMVWPGFESRQ
jgi:hypothetical protein